MSSPPQSLQKTRSLYLTVGERDNPLLPGGKSKSYSSGNAAGMSILGRLPMQECVRVVERGGEAFLKRAGAVYHLPQPLWEEAYFYALQKPGISAPEAEQFAYSVLEKQNDSLNRSGSDAGNTYLAGYVWKGERYRPPYKESKRMTREPSFTAGQYPAPAPATQRVSPGGAVVSGLRGPSPQRPAAPGSPPEIRREPQTELREYVSVDRNTYAIPYKEDGKVIPGYSNLVLLHAMAEISKGGSPNAVFAAIGLELVDARNQVVWDVSLLRVEEAEEEEDDENVRGFNHG